MKTMSSAFQFKASIAPIVIGFLALLPIQIVYGTPIDDESESSPEKSRCGFPPRALAVTCHFTASTSPMNPGIPISARSEFSDDWDTTKDIGLSIAEHELLHAIGFTSMYKKFDKKLIETPGRGKNGIPDDSESYSNNSNKTGIMLVMKSDTNDIKANDIKANKKTWSHSDPKATGKLPWPATHYNQSNDFMQLELHSDKKEKDFSVLNDAFDWQKSGIRIMIGKTIPTMSQTDISIIKDAISDVNKNFPYKPDAPLFTWNVAEASVNPSNIPEIDATSGTLAIGLLLGVLVLLGERRRHPQPEAAG